MCKLYYKAHNFESGLFGPMIIDCSGSIELDKIKNITQTGIESECMIINLKDGSVIGDKIIITEIYFE